MINDDLQNNVEENHDQMCKPQKEELWIGINFTKDKPSHIQ